VEDRARQAAAQSELLRQQAEKEKQELRARLLQQLNTVLSTRDSARGLIANMSDVLFMSGSFELLTAARERLAKVFGIVLAYPSLHLAVEGHTDSVGSDEYNRQLSETPGPGGARLSGPAGNFSGRDRSQRLREN
jgi:outer membrane protein OmpA-like peptidoglycan-associated protein